VCYVFVVVFVVDNDVFAVDNVVVVRDGVVVWVSDPLCLSSSSALHFP
jgi:hypothetical protein